MTLLDELESRSIYVLREAFCKLPRLAMLWSIGKDSTVMLWLARKAFFGHVPFPLIHIDTSYKIPEMIAYRDQMVAAWGLELIVGQNREDLAAGRTFPCGGATRVECCGLLKKDPLRAVLDERGFTGLIVGVRRDEDATRAKERYFSPRDREMEWRVEDQPPELWGQHQTDFLPGEHVRVHPLLHWTEINIWEYIEREGVPFTPLYLADERGERYRSLGCAPCTGRVRSGARTAAEVLTELRLSRTPERAGRAQDQESEGAFERLRRDGYM